MALKDCNILDLPDAPDFISNPPNYTVSEMVELCTPLLPYWNTQRYSKPEPPFLGDAFSLVENSEVFTSFLSKRGVSVICSDIQNKK